MCIGIDIDILVKRCRKNLQRSTSNYASHRLNIHLVPGYQYQRPNNHPFLAHVSAGVMVHQMPPLLCTMQVQYAIGPV